MIDSKLYSLIAVNDMGSFTKAAESLALTQPAVSQHIRLLEEELGVRIFERSRTELRLTKEGEIVLNCARKILALMDNLTQDLEDQKDKLTSINVGITYSAEMNHIAEHLASFADTRGNLRVRIVTDETPKLITMLKNYELDFVIVEGRILDEDLQTRNVGTDSAVFIVPKNHPLAKENSVTLEQIQKEKLILRKPRFEGKNAFIAALEANDISIHEFELTMELDNIPMIKDLVLHGYGTTVLAKNACADELKSGKLKALDIEGLDLTREINIVYTDDMGHQELLDSSINAYMKKRKKK